MQGMLSHFEATDGLRPRHPVVCIIDIVGLAVTTLLLATHETTLLVAILPAAVLLQYVVSLIYHWLPQSNLRQNADHAMITLLITATFIPYWGRLLPVSEMLWRLPVLAVLTSAIILLRCTRTSLRRSSAILYPILGSFGLVVSFNELQVWLSPPGLAMFWLGIGCYFLQFVVWARHKPNPKAELFGYREVQHTILLCGTTLHSIVVLNYL